MFLWKQIILLKLFLEILLTLDLSMLETVFQNIRIMQTIHPKELNTIQTLPVWYPR